MWIVAVIAGIVLLPIVYVAVTYNRLVNLRNLIQNAWSNVDTELKRRYDLIPNLVNTVKGYAAHERDVLDRVVQARTRAAAAHGSPRDQARDENELVRAIRQLFAVVESYPQLKASEHFLELQKELVNTEDCIQAARRFYNGNVKDLNNLVEQFPSNWIVRRWRFEPAEFFEIERVNERGPIAVGFG